MKRHFIVIIAVLVAAMFALPGCGGGGGGAEKVALSGTVTDVAGNMIPGADIKLDGRIVTRSLMNGTYKITSLASGDHNVEADAMVNGHLWVGTRAVTVYNDGPTNSMDLLIGQWDELGDVDGSVTDASNNALPNARIIAVAHYPQNKSADQASVISKVVIADSNGRYTIHDLPASITVGSVKETIVYDVTASSVGLSGQPRGFQNVMKTATVAGGMVTSVDFSLQSSSTVAPSVPSGWTSSGAIDVISYTVPTSIATRAPGSPYEAVKSCISERTRKIVALNRTSATRSPTNGSLIENDVVWYNTWTTAYGFNLPDNLAGFSIYRGVEVQPNQNGNYRLDFVRNPAIVTYADASAALTPGMVYYYAVSALSTSYLDANNQFNPLAESSMSYPASVRPIDKLVVLGPADGASVSIQNALFNWVGMSDARSYRLFVYADYPVLDSMFTPQGDPARPDHLPAWGQTDSGTSPSVFFSDPSFTLVSGHTYWWVVMASNASTFDNGNAYSISELRSFTAR